MFQYLFPLLPYSYTAVPTTFVRGVAVVQQYAADRKQRQQQEQSKAIGTAFTTGQQQPHSSNPSCRCYLRVAVPVLLPMLSCTWRYGAVMTLLSINTHSYRSVFFYILLLHLLSHGSVGIVVRIPIAATQLVAAVLFTARCTAVRCQYVSYASPVVVFNAIV